MAKYLAKYSVLVDMFDGGAWMPDPEPRKPEHYFEADNDKEASRIAEGYMKTFKDTYFNPTSKLDSLLKIEDVELKR